MNLPGLTDSVANVVQEPVKCPECGGVSRLANGLCLTCLLQTGLKPRDESTHESFVSLLRKIDIRDSDWQIGHYQILEEIARGGMGVIYRARQQFSRRIVALKRVLSYHSDSPQTLVRFRREAEAASLLDHPNILPIYEVGESDDGLPFFAMKFATGGSLRDAGPALQRMPARIVPLILSVARAVHSAHMQGILHRDLKPGNILLDGRGEPLVSDFGLAKWLDTSNDLTRTLTIFGTPGYIAPEQACGSAALLGPTADVYSLGAILFDLLAGRPPFLGEHALAVISQASEKNAPRLRTLAPSVDRDLETICSRCLERDPATRYSSAAELADDLERWCGGVPILARPVSAAARFWRWARRNPALAASGAICLALACLSGVRISEHYTLQATLQSDAATAHSVAVLPFLDLDSAQPDNAIAKEVAELLRLNLSRIGPCRIVFSENAISNSSTVPRSEEIMAAVRQARVRLALTGTKRWVNGLPVYAIHLVDPTQTGDAFSIAVDPPSSRDALYDSFQNNASQFYKLLGAQPEHIVSASARNKVAADLISAGRSLIDRRTATDCQRAVDCFERATAIDPSSAQAHAFLAIARAGLSFMNGKGELVDLAQASAVRAIELDPLLGTPHRALAAIMEQRGDFISAREEAFRAIELDGADDRSIAHLSMIAKTLGRPDLALRWASITKHLQRQPANNEFIIGDCWADLGEDARAEQAYVLTKQLRPELPEGWMGLSRLQMFKGNFAGAIQSFSEQTKNFSQFDFSPQMMAQLYFFAREFREAKKIYSELALKDPLGGGNFYGAISYQSALGWLQLHTGGTRAGRLILKSALRHELKELAKAPRHPEILYRVAAIEASLGLRRSALDHLRSAVGEGWIDFRSLNLDPRFDAVRSDDSFKRISESIATKVASLRRSMPTD